MATYVWAFILATIELFYDIMRMAAVDRTAHRLRGTCQWKYSTVWNEHDHDGTSMMEKEPGRFGGIKVNVRDRVTPSMSDHAPSTEQHLLQSGSGTVY